MGNDHQSLNGTPRKDLDTIESPSEFSAKTPRLQYFSSSNVSNKSLSIISRVASFDQDDVLPASSPSAFFASRSGSLPRYHHKKRKSSLLIVSNGITGKYISSRICKIAAKFWTNNIDNLSFSEQLEIGCSIFFGMMASSTEMSKLMKSNMPKEQNFEKTGFRYLDMMGWCIRNTIVDNIDLFEKFTKLGAIHKAMGINIEHYGPMLEAMHEVFAYYFGPKYTIEVKYALDEIFSLTAQIMTGSIDSHLKDLNQHFGGDNIPFLQSLDVCLESSIGTEYLYRFLSQTWCDEIVIFLQSLTRFKKGMSDKERYCVAKEITKMTINPRATFALNLSYACRQTALEEMSKLEGLFTKKLEFNINTDFFAEVEAEVQKLIADNHWSKFVQGIETLRYKSFNVEFEF